ncbi:hypothetical protein AUEXF2481DRAFT_40209 [Aureobasidium subglaciale EXF-2481]|uniref:Uncharacterized protein n=1 Tax=Aureobasidium subglaciale (strain EXF-2481) TaxID=1043005 RepID=A0A074YAY3_AURSE|nr:uncharacterized protein AUEXF2481DRAFT_40209 [Aureobasidium subglaciale EXF-2481]KEQ94958.1 hypothetical protein AUEXF2481DRAFT_40209 [Aureobasidium subglaciale EXF-2481]
MSHSYTECNSAIMVDAQRRRLLVACCDVDGRQHRKYFSFVWRAGMEPRFYRHKRWRLEVTLSLSSISTTLVTFL